MTYTTSHYTPPNLKLPPMPVRSTEMPASEIDYANKMHEMARKMNMKAGVPRGTTDYGKPFSKAKPGESTLASETHLKNIIAYLADNPWSTYKEMQASVGVHNKSIHNYMSKYIADGLIVRNGKNQYNLPEAPQ